MRKIATHVAVTAIVLGSVAFFGATSSGASTTKATPVAPPFVTGNKYLSVNVDTVIGGGSPGVVGGGCYLENSFIQGQTVVFRMWGIDNATGGPLIGSPLTKANVQSVVIKDLPGVSPNPVMAYSTRDGYYTFGWFTSTKTPTGLVPYKVIVTLAPTKAVYKTIRVKVGSKVTTVKVVVKAAHGPVSYAYSEASLTKGTGSLPAPSMLTINAAA
jgi:hypothetical protein